MYGKVVLTCASNSPLSHCSQGTEDYEIIEVVEGLPGAQTRTPRGPTMEYVFFKEKV